MDKLLMLSGRTSNIHLVPNAAKIFLRANQGAIKYYEPEQGNLIFSRDKNNYNNFTTKGTWSRKDSLLF